jgi:5-formyltetrahydrofolate cyclo-ligase
MSQVYLSKKELRLHYRTLRSALGKEERKAKETVITSLCLQHLCKLPLNAIIATYKALPSEVNTEHLTKALRAKGYQIALPCVVGDQRPLEFRLYDEGTLLTTDGYKIAQPYSGAQIVVPQIIIVPMLAFDQRGYRLGFGKGFYDRTIAELKKKHNIRTIGIAYACQQAAKLPNDSYDERLDIIITEKEVIKI